MEMKIKFEGDFQTAINYLRELEIKTLISFKKKGRIYIFKAVL